MEKLNRQRILSDGRYRRISKIINILFIYSVSNLGTKNSVYVEEVKEIGGKTREKIIGAILESYKFHPFSILCDIYYTDFEEF